jgi:hypothetical protein
MVGFNLNSIPICYVVHFRTRETILQASLASSSKRGCTYFWQAASFKHFARYFSHLSIEKDFLALIFAYFPPLKGFKVIGQPLLSLGICAFFSRQVSRSSTVHLHNEGGVIISGRKDRMKDWCRDKITHLYPLVSRCKKTNIVTFAIFIPKHVLGPDPKGMKLYGFCISWIRINTDSLFMSYA